MSMLDDPKIKASIQYMKERLLCKKRNTTGELVFLTRDDIDVTAFMCGWDACKKAYGIE